MEGYNTEAKVTEKVTAYATDGDQNEIRITIKNYDQPIFKTNDGIEILSSFDTEYVKRPEGAEDDFYGQTTFFPANLSKEDIEKQMDYARINIDNYKSKK